MGMNDPLGTSGNPFYELRTYGKYQARIAILVRYTLKLLYHKRQR
jgi:hypothetical protein